MNSNKQNDQSKSKEKKLTISHKKISEKKTVKKKQQKDHEESKTAKKQEPQPFVF